MSKITALKKEHTQDFSAEIIPAFWKKRENTSGFTWSENNIEQLLAQYIAEAMANNKGEIICIYAADNLSPAAINLLLEASANHRIYCLLSRRGQEATQLAGKVLLRYNDDLQAANFALFAPKKATKKGYFSTERQPFFFDLQASQIEDLYSYFLHAFWHEAKQEILEAQQAATAVKPITNQNLGNSRAFAADKTAWQNVFSTQEMQEICAPYWSADFAHLPQKNTNWLFVQHQAAENLKEIGAAQNANIRSLSPDFCQKLPFFALNAQATNGILWAATQNKKEKTLALALNAAQAKILKAYFGQLWAAADWDYVAQQPLAQLNGAIIQTLADGQTQQVKAQKDNFALIINATKWLNINDLSALKPVFDLTHGYALKHNYQWTIRPFTRPAAAQKAKLYSDWQNWQTNTQAAKEKMHSQIENIESQIEQSRLKPNIDDDFKRDLLGITTKIRQTKQELADSNTAAKDINTAQKILDNLQALQEKYSQYLQNISTAELKLSIRIERQKLENLKIAFETWKNQAKKEADAQQKQAEIAYFAFAQSEKLPPQNGKNVADAHAAFLAFANKQKEEARKAKKNEAKKDEAINWEAIIGQLGNLNSLCKKPQTIYNDEEKKELQKIEAQARSLNNEEKKLSAPAPNQQNSGLADILQNNKLQEKQANLNTNNQSKFSLPTPPKEDLPVRQFTLYEQQNQRFLAFKYWTEETAAAAEAQRLKAALCCEID